MLATVLTDAHRFGPAHYGLPSLYLMTHDDRPDTLASPPPSQDDIVTSPHASEAPLARRSTQPPGADDAEAVRVMATMIPDAPRTPAALAHASDSVLGDAIRQISEAAADIRKGREERQRFEEQSQRNHEETIAAILKADANQTRNYEMVRDQLRKLKDADERHDRRLADGDQRFRAIENSIAALKDELIALITRATADAATRIEALERDLADAKASRDAAPTATTA